MNRLTVHGGSDAETAKVPEVRNARSLDVSFLGGVPDGASDHVFGVTLDTSGDFERSLLTPVVCRLDADDTLLALRERPGLVEYHRIEVPGFLHGNPVADEHPVLGSRRGVDRDHERNCESERAGTR